MLLQYKTIHASANKNNEKTKYIRWTPTNVPAIGETTLNHRCRHSVPLNVMFTLGSIVPPTSVEGRKEQEKNWSHLAKKKYPKTKIKEENISCKTRQKQMHATEQIGEAIGLDDKHIQCGNIGSETNVENKPLVQNLRRKSKRNRWGKDWPKCNLISIQRIPLRCFCLCVQPK